MRQTPQPAWGTRRLSLAVQMAHPALAPGTQRGWWLRTRTAPPMTNSSPGPSGLSPWGFSIFYKVGETVGGVKAQHRAAPKQFPPSCLGCWPTPTQVTWFFSAMSSGQSKTWPADPGAQVRAECHHTLPGPLFPLIPTSHA